MLQVEADGRLVTIFSAPNYCDQMGNEGAIIRIGKDLECKYRQFKAVPHPQVRVAPPPRRLLPPRPHDCCRFGRWPLPAAAAS